LLSHHLPPGLKIQRTGEGEGSAAVGPSLGRQGHLVEEEEEVIKQLKLLRADGWRQAACWV